jgi:hypothetical protein
LRGREYILFGISDRATVIRRREPAAPYPVRVATSGKIFAVFLPAFARLALHSNHDPAEIDKRDEYSNPKHARQRNR